MRMVVREPPADRAAQVVADHHRPLAAGEVEQADHVPRERIERVGVHAGRLLAGVVAALVRREDAVAGRGERGDLLAPAVPELGEAVQQHHQRSVPGPGRDHVQLDAVGLDEELPMHASPLAPPDAVHTRPAPR